MLDGRLVLRNSARAHWLALSKWTSSVVGAFGVAAFIT
jgi:hypothetical protein